MIRDILENADNTAAIPDSVVLANKAAWHETGIVLDSRGEKGLTIAQALPASGLDFSVAKVPIFGPNGQEIERRFGVMREDNEVILGVVGSTWEPMQPVDGFAVVDDLIQQAGGEHCWIESAGALDGGRKIWVLAHIDTELQIAGESYRSYLLFTTGFDGRLSTTAAAVDERVVCANTLNYAVFGEANDSGYVLRVRHTTKAAERIKEAHAILGMRHKRAEELAKQGEWLVSQSWDDGAFNNFLETLMPIPEAQEGKPSETMINNRRDQVRRIYFDAENLNPIRGTVWGGFQSVLEYDQHNKKFKDTETQTANQLGITHSALPQQAYDLAMAFAMS